MTYEEIRIGESAQFSKRLTRDIVETFAEISGDCNPLHIDVAFGKSSRFKDNIVHGMLASSLICRVLGIQLPGMGTIHVSQSLKFEKPIYIDENVTARVTVVGKDDEKKRIRMKTEILNEAGLVATTGEAVVIPGAS